MEREILGATRKPTTRTGSEGELAWWRPAEEVRDRHPELNQGQRQAAERYACPMSRSSCWTAWLEQGRPPRLPLCAREPKPTATGVEGFAPTSRAAQKLAEAGIETKTLQAHLAKGQRADTGERRLYVVDEISLASTRQMHEFASRLYPNDRVLLMGDIRQHESI